MRLITAIIVCDYYDTTVTDSGTKELNQEGENCITAEKKGLYDYLKESKEDMLKWSTERGCYQGGRNKGGIL